MQEHHHSTPQGSDTSLPHSGLQLSAGQQLVAGIIGGMGPLPHIHFERMLLEKMRLRGVEQEQDYPIWITINAASTRDRTACILQKTEECVPALLGAGLALANAGAHFLVTICNTAHAFREHTADKLPIPWIDLLKVVALRLKQSPSPIDTVGLLATDGTIQTGLYPQALSLLGLRNLRILYPSELRQKFVMDAIYHNTFGIKSAASLAVSNQALKRFELAAHELLDSGASAIISGCTEISLCSAELRQRGIPIIDPLDALADAVIALSYGEENISAFV